MPSSSPLQARISAIGTYVPEHILTNDEPLSDGGYERRMDRSTYRNSSAPNS